ncbi:MAG: TetR/AcrR family transcriptional regulator [Candidatus Hodarchaeota archaeon]
MSSKRRTRNKQQKIARIKDAFRSLVENLGYLETTNKSIAQHAKVSVGLVYKYFPRGKVDILRQLILDSQAVFAATEEQQIPDLPSSFSEQSLSLESLRGFIHKMLEFVVDAHVRNAKFIRALEIALLADSSSFEDIVGWSQQVLNFQPILLRLEKFNVVKEPPTEKDMIIRTNIIDLVIHRYIFYAGNPFSNHEDFLDYLSDLFIQLFKIELPT